MSNEKAKMLFSGLVLVNIGWLSCVMLPAMGLWYLVPIIIAVLLAAHFALFGVHRWEVMLIASAAAYGFTIDTMLGLTGVLVFGETGALLPWLAPLWLVLLWANFSLSITRAFGFLASNLPLAAVIGAIAGPLAYLAGSKLGDISFSATNPTLSMVVLSIVWCATIPLLLILSNYYQRRFR